MAENQNKNQTEACLYPEEVGASIRKEKAFCINSYLSVAKSSDGQSPYMIYNQKFSRFKITIIDNTKDKRFVDANIPVTQIADIIARTEYAFRREMDAETDPAGSDESLSPAYTVKIASGTLKGKTPAEALLEDPENNKKLLNSQYEWLRKNLGKYPGNRKQMDAIKDASKLFSEGKLNASENMKKLPVVQIYNAEVRALIRKKREDGMCFVYTLKITWNVGENSPVTVDISNFYAPVMIREDGRINPKISERDPDSVVSLTYSMAAWEWMNIIQSIKANMSQFELLHAKECFADAEQTARSLREKAKE